MQNYTHWLFYRGDRGSLSESGYGSRHKVFKGEKVNFRVGSPEFDTGVGRYDADFLVLETIGSGHFGTVSKVRKRLDGAIYAIKRIQDQVKQASLYVLPCDDQRRIALVPSCGQIAREASHK